MKVRCDKEDQPEEMIKVCISRAAADNPITQLTPANNLADTSCVLLLVQVLESREKAKGLFSTVEMRRNVLRNDTGRSYGVRPPDCPSQ